MYDNMSLHTFKYLVTPVSCFQSLFKMRKLSQSENETTCSLDNFRSQATVETISFLLKTPRVLL